MNGRAGKEKLSPIRMEENFKTSNNKLFCNACREPLSTKRSVIEGHIRPSRHVKGKEKLAAKEAREKDISDMLTKYDSHVHRSCWRNSSN